MTRMFTITLALLATTLGACSTGAADPVTAPEPMKPAEEVARGAYLVMTSACHDCHTPFRPGPSGPEPDMSRMLSGHPAEMVVPTPPAPVGPWLTAVAATNTAWAGPWGVSFTANLTPDADTGIGTWTRQNFIDTIRNGRHMGAGRPLLPPMPFPMYKHMTDEDLGAIYAYLRTIPALPNRVPPPIPPASAAEARQVAR